jgi:hypothetical protein
MARFTVEVELDFLNEDGSIDEALRDEISAKVVSSISAAAQKSVQQKVDALLDEKMKGMSMVIGDQLNAKMEAFFNEPRNITDKWGDVTKKNVCINDMLKQACEAFMTQNVDRDGHPTDGYSTRETMSRASWFAKKIGEPMYSDAITRTVKDITDKVASQVQSLATAQLGERLAKLAGIPELIAEVKK